MVSSIKDQMKFMDKLDEMISMIVYQLGGLIAGEAAFSIWTVVALIALAGLLYLLLRPYPESETLRGGQRSAVRA